MFSAAGQLWYFLMKDVIFFLTAIFFACFFLSLWLLWFISLMLQDPSLLWSFLPFFFPPICVTRCLAASMLAAVVVLSGTLSGNRILVTGGALDGNPLLHRKTLQRQKSPRCFLVAFCSSPATASLAYLLQVDPAVFPWAGSRSWSWGCCERDGMEASGVGLVGLVCSWGVFLAPEPACFAVLLFFSADSELLNIASLSSLNAIPPRGYPVQKTHQRAMKDCGGKGENWGAIFILNSDFISWIELQ